jgi:hypothetical protein
MIFIVGGLLLALVVFYAGFLFNRRKYPGARGIKKSAEEARILYLLLGLASLSILAYIAFTFGKR